MLGFCGLWIPEVTIALSSTDSYPHNLSSSPDQQPKIVSSLLLVLVGSMVSTLVSISSDSYNSNKDITFPK